MAKRLTTEEFIRKSKLVHGELYDYSLVDYVTNKIKVKIICSKHGVFLQAPTFHMKGQGCSKCGSERTGKANGSTKEEFIEKSKLVHGELYDYSLVDYVISKTKVKIICSKHGVFLQQPFSHSIGQGCPKCGDEKSGKALRLTTEEFIKKSKLVHGELYDYSLVDYVNCDIKINIICYKHGVFLQNPHAHLMNHGCPKCGDERKKEYNTSTTEEFIRKSKLVHGELYDYSLVDYVYNSIKVNIICRVHGLFSQTPKLHLRCCGCPKCSHQVSKQEKEIVEFIRTFYDGEIITSDKKIIKPLELDIYIPEFNMAIEYNGVYWHSEQMGKDRNYHLNKTNLCKDEGIQLFHIFENEWLNNKDLWKSVIKNKMGFCDHKIGARKCKVIDISHKQFNTFYNEFLDINHLQGSCGGSIRYGLFYEDTMVALMTFGKSRFNKNYKYELIRFCSKKGYQIMGGASRIIKRFRSDHKGSIISFANKRWSNGNLYKTIGFDYSHDSAPNYFYFHSSDRMKLESRNKYQKHKLKNKLKKFDPNMTEYENMVNNGFDRIWDSGNKIYYLD